MNRSQDDIQVLKKVNTIVKEKLPGFASRYFSYNMDIKTPRTLFGYSLDLKSFFEYLENTSFNVKRMTIKEFGSITKDIIENYLEDSYSYPDGKGNIKKRSIISRTFILRNILFLLSDVTKAKTYISQIRYARRSAITL